MRVKIYRNGEFIEVKSVVVDLPDISERLKITQESGTLRLDFSYTDHEMVVKPAYANELILKFVER